jgi:Transglutaminase-like superfamily
MHEGIGVCRDFAHLAIALCRCINIPARYCTGYLGDIGVPVDPNSMDFSAWFEVFLDGRWYSMDPRHNHPRIGRIVMGRGRDAADVAMSTAFGTAKLARFEVMDPGAGSGWLIADVSNIPERGLLSPTAIRRRARRGQPEIRRPHFELPAGCANAKANIPVPCAATPPLTERGPPSIRRRGSPHSRLLGQFVGHALVIDHP